MGRSNVETRLLEKIRPLLKILHHRLIKIYLGTNGKTEDGECRTKAHRTRLLVRVFQWFFFSKTPAIDEMKFY